MLKVKNLTHLSKKNWKKAGILTTVARKIELDFFCNLVSLDFNQNFVLYRMNVISGR